MLDGFYANLEQSTLSEEDKALLIKSLSDRVIEQAKTLPPEFEVNRDKLLMLVELYNSATMKYIENNRQCLTDEEYSEIITDTSILCNKYMYEALSANFKLLYHQYPKAQNFIQKLFG